MEENIDAGDIDLSDAELIEVLKNHGMNRRSLMKAFGVGAGVAALGGTAAGKGEGEGRGSGIDDVYGAPYAAGDSVPSGLVDHPVGLHLHLEGGGIPTYFDPVGLHVKPGEIVEFQTHGNGLHTVTSFHSKFSEPPFIVLPDRVPTDTGFTSPLLAENDSWLYQFTTKGVYDLLCLPHVSFGMVIRIVVYDPEEDDIESDTFEEYGELSHIPPGEDENVFALPSMILNSTALDPSNIVAGDGKVGVDELPLP